MARGLKEWGGRRCPPWAQALRRWLSPDAQPCRDEPGFDTDPRPARELGRDHDKLGGVG